MGDYTFGAGVEPHKRWPVAWYNPFILLKSARELLSSSDVIRNADPRELWNAPFQSMDHSAETEPDGSFWFDFVSDTGDGGNATYAVARAIQAEKLAPSGPFVSEHSSYPRGRILYFGGDLCYPSANMQEYQYRFLELFEGARDTVGPDPAGRSAYGIPQNHDWFDSISTFKRYFVNRNNGEVFGLKTPQSRSYFATRLPHQWWVLGFDFALTGDLDRAQYEAFRRLAGDVIGGEEHPEIQIQAGDHLILIYPEPYWTRPLGDSAPEGYPKRYQRLEAMLEGKGVKIRVRLAGDVHHYCREVGEPLDPCGSDLLITCGSGGAFLHPTHAKALMQPKVKYQVSSPDAMSDELRTATRIGSSKVRADLPSAYTCSAVYPERTQSRLLCRANLCALFKFAWNNSNLRGGDLSQGVIQGNLLFSLLLGVVYWAAIYSNSLSLSDGIAGDVLLNSGAVASLSWWDIQCIWLNTLFFSPLSLGVHGVLLGLCLALAKDEEEMMARWVWPSLHFGVHVVFAATIFWLTLQLRCQTGSSVCWAPVPVVGLVVSLLHLVVGTLCGGLLTGCYLWLMARAGLMWNNAFSPIACEDYKGFLRFRIDDSGRLTGHFFGCDQVPKKWQRNTTQRGVASGDIRPAWVETTDACKAQWRLVDKFTLDRK